MLIDEWEPREESKQEIQQNKNTKKRKKPDHEDSLVSINEMFGCRNARERDDRKKRFR